MNIDAQLWEKSNNLYLDKTIRLPKDSMEAKKLTRLKGLNGPIPFNLNP